jgi:hypothetical protein
MSRPYIVVEVAPDGALKVEAKEFSGPDCEKATAWLEQALGTTAKRVRTADYARRPQLAHTNKASQ